MVRTAGDPAALAPAIRRAVLGADANVASFDVMTLDTAIAATTERERFVLSLLTGFGALALALAVVGIYGVVSYVVVRRRREIAVRIAMGARPRDIFTQVTGGTVGRAVVGIAAGLAFTAIAAPLMQPLLFATSIRDTATYSAVAAVLLAAAFCGAPVPAPRSGPRSGHHPSRGIIASRRSPGQHYMGNTGLRKPPCQSPGLGVSPGAARPILTALARDQT